MEKTKAIIAYIINYFQCNDAPNNLGKTKLVKILWFADREFMYRYYKRLTNLQYIKMDYGPLPKDIDSILREMEREHLIKEFQTFIGPYNQLSFMCLQEPSLDNFTAQEIDVLTAIITSLRNKSASELSEQTHDEIWEKTSFGDIMDVEAVFLQDIRPLPQEDDMNA